MCSSFSALSLALSPPFKGLARGSASIFVGLAIGIEGGIGLLAFAGIILLAVTVLLDEDSARIFSFGACAELKLKAAAAASAATAITVFVTTHKYMMLGQFICAQCFSSKQTRRTVDPLLLSSPLATVLVLVLFGGTFKTVPVPSR